MWEIIPGLQFWLVFIGAIFLSYYQPVAAALFIIVFDLYWLLKAINVASHLLASYFKFRFFVRLDGQDYARRLQNLAAYKKFLAEQLNSRKKRAEKVFYSEETRRVQKLLDSGIQALDFSSFYHVILIPFVDEGFEVLDNTIGAISQSHYPKEKMILLLASEERAGESAQKTAREIENKYASHFFKIFITSHPDGLEGEIKGKSANATFAVKSILPELEKLSINPKQVLISNFDSDTIVHPQ